MAHASSVSAGAEPAGLPAEAARAEGGLVRLANRWFRPLTWAALIGNVVIVVTGGAVRLTASGLGCPTWPECTRGSLVTRPSLGIHGVIEFSNRMLTITLAVVVVLTFIAACLRKPFDRTLFGLTLALGLTIPAQGVIGGIVVLTHLNPWMVGAHFMFSMGLIVLSMVLVRRAAWPTLRREPGPAAARLIGWLVLVASLFVLAAGTVVTGSGPHAGAAGAARNGFSPVAVSQLHTDLVFLLIGVTVGALVLARALGQRRLAGTVALLLAVELGQGIVGYVQYFTGLPIGLVNLHLFGASVIVAVAADVLLRARQPTAGLQPASAPATAG